MAVDRNEIESWYRELQSSLCRRFEEIDGNSSFGADRWSRPGGGGGLTRVLQGNGHLEKAAVNVSAVWGNMPEMSAESEVDSGESFFATGISMIIHPRNPHAPTFHANLRYFSTDSGRAWFGGGVDLTPHYLYEEDAVHFHGTLHQVCERHPVADYTAWKKACDEYFRIPHRGEARGIGGIFFDHLDDRLDDVWAFQRDLGEHLGDCYLPIVERRSTQPFSEEQESWQLRRRGRYVEFNLVYDRGTRFGLETGGRTESILVSLPPRVRWDYAPEPAPDTAEGRLLALLQGPPVDWIGTPGAVSD